MPLLTGIALEYARARRTRRLPKDKLKHLQTRKLRKTMRIASTAPYYRDALRALNKGPEDFDTPEKLRGFPLLPKADLAKRASSLRTGGEVSLQMNTSGTTGNPTRFLYSAEMQRVTIALLLRELITIVGVRPWTKFVSVWPPTSTWRTVPMPDGQARPLTVLQQLPASKRFKYIAPRLSHVWSEIDDPAADARMLAEKDPEFIVCTPSRMMRIARLGGDAVRRIRPRKIIFGSEIFTDATRRTIENIFGAEVIDMYGAVEVGPVGIECRSGTGIHTNEDYSIYEVIRDGEQVGPGQTGQLVLTFLHNPAMPLIRYETGDFVRMSADDEKCECGSSVMRLSKIAGRCVDGVVTTAGFRVPPLEVAEAVESSIGQVDYYLVQRKLEDFELRLHKREPVVPEAIEALRVRLGEMLGVVPSLSVSEATDEDFARKHSPIVSEVRSPSEP